MPVGIPTVMVNDCLQINCPQLFQLTTACNAHESSCTGDEVSSTLSNFCHENGVKKQSSRVYSGPDLVDYTTTMRVQKEDGNPCYILVMSGTSGGELESWTFQTPTGQEVARGEWDEALNQLTLICGGVRYILDEVGCPGTDGEPEPDQCDEGDCSIP